MAQRSRIGFVVALLVAVGALATGCSVVSKVKQAVHTVEGNKATIDSFTQNLQSTARHALRGHLHDDGQLAGHGRLRRRPVQWRARLPRDADGIRPRPTCRSS